MNPILSIIGSAIQPIAGLIDNLHTSEAEKLEAKASLFGLQADLTGKVLEYEGQLLSARSEIIKAEANGQGVLQRNWRPVTMLTFLVLVVCDSFGWLPFRLAEQAWTLLQIGLGGYVVGRSLEKVAPSLVNVKK